MKWIALFTLLSIGPALSQAFMWGPVPTAPSSTAAALPSCIATLRGSMFVVTDALVPVALATLAGGGAVTVLVFCNGSNWIVG